MKKLCALFLLILSSPAVATGISGTSAPCDNETLSKYTGTANIEIDWEPNVIGLSWYDGNTQISGPTSCVYDGTITVPPAPTKLGYTFNGWKVIHVPGGYTELEYIESNGSQYINTAYVPLVTDTIETHFKTLGTLQGGIKYLYGTRTQYLKNGFAIQYLQSFWIQYGEKDTATLGQPAANTEYTVIHTGPTYSVNGNSATNPGSTPTLVYPLYLFTLNNSGEAYPLLSSMKLYSFKITAADGTSKRNMIPAKRNSDNVLGLYDTVTDTFFTNAGTGTFTAGPAVQ